MISYSFPRDRVHDDRMAWQMCLDFATVINFNGSFKFPLTLIASNLNENKQRLKNHKKYFISIWIAYKNLQRFWNLNNVLNGNDWNFSWFFFCFSCCRQIYREWASVRRGHFSRINLRMIALIGLIFHILLCFNEFGERNVAIIIGVHNL